MPCNCDGTTATKTDAAVDAACRSLDGGSLPADDREWFTAVSRNAKTRLDDSHFEQKRGTIRCFDSVTVVAQFEYIIIDGVTGWHHNPMAHNFQKLYEQPSCTDPKTGLPCYEVDRLRLDCAGLMHPPSPMGVVPQANAQRVLAKWKAAFESEWFARLGTGIAQVLTNLQRRHNRHHRFGEGIPDISTSYDDAISDQYNIGRGFQFRSKGCARFQ